MSRENEIKQISEDYENCKNNFSIHKIKELRAELKGIQEERDRIVSRLTMIRDLKHNRMTKVKGDALIMCWRSELLDWMRKD